MTSHDSHGLRALSSSQLVCTVEYTPSTRGSLLDYCWFRCDLHLRLLLVCYLAMLGAVEYPVHVSFDDYGLKENLLRGVYSYGIEKPSAIQQRGFRHLLDGRVTWPGTVR